MPPPVPTKVATLPKGAVLPGAEPTGFEYSQDDIYDGVDTPVANREGFSAHDQGARSEALQEVYEAASGPAVSLAREGSASSPHVSSPLRRQSSTASNQSTYESIDELRASATPPPRAMTEYLYEGQEDDYEDIRFVHQPPTGTGGGGGEDTYEVMEGVHQPPAGSNAPGDFGFGEDTYEVMEGVHQPPAGTGSAPAFVFSQDDVYDGVEADAGKAGFSAHDQTARSTALQEVYASADMGAQTASLTRRSSGQGPTTGVTHTGAGSTGSMASLSRASQLGTDQRWLHGTISRLEAEARLEAFGRREGVFLVRRKAGEAGDRYALSLVVGELYEHHLLAKNEDGLFELNGVPLDKPCVSLASAVRHLCRDDSETSVRLSEGVPCLLPEA
jgi:hypothetical protein